MAEVVNLMEKSEEKKKALEAALSQIEKNYGKGSVMKLGDPENVWKLKPSQPVRWVWTLRWALVDCRKAELSRFMGRKVRAKRPWHRTQC